MEEQAILCLGAIMLIGSGAELVRLHRGNPLLRGLNLMGQAILVGGVASTVLLFSIRFPLLQPVGTLAILVAFALCHSAMSKLADPKATLESATRMLVLLQAIFTVLGISGLLPSRAAVVLSSLVLATEIGLVLRLVEKSFNIAENTPARSTAWLCRALVSFNLVRGAVGAGGLLQAPTVRYWSDTVTYGLLIACGVGLGFSFFSMTTSSLTTELAKQATTDPLTKACNRRAFLEQCRLELERAKRSQSAFSLLLVDLDHFKRLNDTFGHQAGDQALCLAVERFRNATRGVDTICRWGGEEFAILLPGATSEAAQIIAERVRRSLLELREMSVPVEAWRSFPLTTSIGATTYVGQQTEMDELLKQADAALYSAKSQGRDRTTAYNASLTAQFRY